MLNTLLRDNDVLSMAHSLEVRPVLLDHPLVELVFSLPDNYKIRNGLLKSVFVDSVKGIIPKEVWQRKKTGFEMPLSDWMNGCLNKRIQEMIHENNFERLLHKNVQSELKWRAINQKLHNTDWLYIVFIAWLNSYEVNY